MSLAEIGSDWTSVVYRTRYSSLPFSTPARPVVGGHFAHLALVKADIQNGISADNPYKYGPEPKKNVTDSFIASALKTATAAKNGRVDEVEDSQDSDDSEAENDDDSSSESSTGSGSKPSSSSDDEPKSKSQSKTYSMTKSRSASRQSATGSVQAHDGNDQKHFGLDH